MDIKLNRIEKKILIAIHRYSYANIGLQELNGYLHFPPIERILSAIGFLEQEGLIKEKEQPFRGYQLTSRGEHYRQEHKMTFSRFCPAVKDIIICAIGWVISGLILAFLK